MQGENNRTTAATPDAAGCAMAQRQMTIREGIAAAIESHNRQIAKLITLRDTTPRVILDMPQPLLAALVYPDNQF